MDSDIIHFYDLSGEMSDYLDPEKLDTVKVLDYLLSWWRSPKIRVKLKNINQWAIINCKTGEIQCWNEDGVTGRTKSLPYEGLAVFKKY
jgi:hypothetical protein